jgi:hypothetical protein
MNTLLEIVDDQTFKKAAELLHDAVFERNWLTFDQAARLVRLELWREVWEESTSKRILPFLYQSSAPHARCVLQLQDVLTCDSNFTEKLTYYHISRLNFQPSINKLEMSGPCFNISITVELLKGLLVDLDERSNRRFSKATVGLGRLKPRKPESP